MKLEVEAVFHKYHDNFREKIEPINTDEYVNYRAPEGWRIGSVTVLTGNIVRIHLHKKEAF